MKAKSKEKETGKEYEKYDHSVKEVMTTSEFTYWLSLYRSRVFERYYSARR